MARETFLPLSKPSFDESDILQVAEVLRSGWITTGPKTSQFEDEFCKFTGAQGGIAVNSGTAGMLITLMALGVGPGDEVITPSMTWVSTVNMIVLLGATPVFVDVDKNTLMTDSEAIEAKISQRTKCIIPVHFAGSAADMDPIRTIGEKHGIPIVEDTAHAIGTEYKGERVGTKGTCVFSFHAIKNLTTGEGGMVCSDSPELLEKIKVLKFHGLSADAFQRDAQGRKPQAEVILPGHKCNMTDIAAALGLSQLQRLESINQKRNYLTDIYRNGLKEIDEISTLGTPSYPVKEASHLMVIRLLSDRIARETFMERLKEKNIGTGIHFKAVHLQNYYQQIGFKRGSLPNTEWNSDRIVSLPLFPAMEKTDVEDVLQAIKEVLIS